MNLGKNFLRLSAFVGIALTLLVSEGAFAYGEYWQPSVQVDCQSFNYAPQQCGTGIYNITTVDLISQYSSRACIYGQTFGIAGNGMIWVGGGCRGRFAVSGY